jgi:predicted amidohydrolase
MKVACIQLNGSREPAENVARACAMIDEVCAKQSPDLIVLPEFFNTIYFSQYREYKKYMHLAEPADGPSLTVVRERAARHGVNIVAPIYEIDAPGYYFDTAFVIDRRGEILGRYRKVHPAATNSLEKLYFRYGSDFPVWEIDGWRIGIVICYDTFFPEAVRALAVQGAELLIFPFAGGMLSNWYELHCIRAFENLAFVAVCDKVGPEDRWTFGGKSVIIDPLGEILCTAGDSEEETIVADLDREQVFDARRRFPIYRDRQPWAYGALTERR